MKLSKLIELLSAINGEHGDIDVFMETEKFPEPNLRSYPNLMEKQLVVKDNKLLIETLK